MISTVAMGRRRKIGVCARILVLRVLFGSIIALGAPFLVQAQSDERTEEIADDGEEITGAKTSNKPGFLFAPIPVSEPVLGTGLAVTGLVIYKPRGAGQFSSHAGLFGGGTSNGTWAVGGLNSMKLRDDSIRVETLIAFAHVNQKYFGIGGNLNPGIDYTQDKFFLKMAPRFRLKRSNWFLGVEYRYENTDTTTDVTIPDEETGEEAPVGGNQRVGGLTAIGAFDSRDNLYSATSGRLFELRLGTFQPWLGSSTNFSTGKIEYRQYVPLRDGRLVLAGRAVSEGLQGDEAPFFELPYLELRGYPRGAIRDDVTLWGEVEARHDLFWRIGAAVFGGVGWTADTYSDIFAGKTRWAGGFGLRYNLRPEDRLKIGMDVAWAAEGKAAIYLRVGEAF